MRTVYVIHVRSTTGAYAYAYVRSQDEAERFLRNVCEDTPEDRIHRLIFSCQEVHL